MQTIYIFHKQIPDYAQRMNVLAMHSLFWFHCDVPFTLAPL